MGEDRQDKKEDVQNCHGQGREKTYQQVSLWVFFPRVHPCTGGVLPVYKGGNLQFCVQYA